MMDIDWQKVVNRMTGPFPEVGAEAPSIESIRKGRPSSDDIGEFSKLTTEIYFFVDAETGKTYTAENHNIVEFGEVPLRDALAYIKKSKERS